jgi:hypothetical protein
MLINAALWLILIGLLMIVPAGCYMTRSEHKGAPPAAH